MINEINIIDDIFDDPDYIAFEARKQNFYNIKNYPNDNEGFEIYFSGQRTVKLNTINGKLYKYCNDTILRKLIHNNLNSQRFYSIHFSYDALSYFHYQTKCDTFEEDWFHRDYAMYAAVIYLQKKPKPNSGTIIKRNNEEFIVENKYNRLVFYRADLQHSVQGTFGNNVYDGRLTFCSFFGELNVNLNYNPNFQYNDDYGV